MNTLDDEALHRLVAAAQPPSPAADLAVLRSLGDLNREVAAQARAQSMTDPARPAGSGSGVSELSARRGRRSSRSTRVAVVALAAILATGGAAAAAVHLARTGLFGAPGMTENDNTEWLDPSAPDFPDVAASLAPEYVTYAPATDATSATSWVVQRSRAADARVQETGVARTYATFGQCSWLAAWQTTAPGTVEHTRAAEQLDASAGWPVFAATDGGGVVASMTALADAVAHEDGAQVADLAPMACDEDLLTVLGADQSQAQR